MKKKKINEEIPDNKIQLWINIFKDGKGRYSVSNIYGKEATAEETGKMVKGYFKTVPIEFEDNDNEQS